MALIKCPECQKEISDKAMICPNFGFPISKYLIENDSNIFLGKDETVYVPKNGQIECDACGALNENGSMYFDIIHIS